MAVNRRGFVQIAGTWFFSAAVPFFATARAAPGTRVVYPQGVASGDPQPDSVLLWTRAEPAQTADVDLLLQVSTSAGFSRVVIEEKLTARAADDYTVRAHISGLEPARHYYYRFVAAAG